MPENRDSFNALASAAKHAERYLESLDQLPVGPTVDAETLRQRLAVPLGDEPLNPAQVVDELAGAVDGGLNNVASPRFFGWVNGGSLPAALGADWLTSAWEQNAGMYIVSPAGAMVEEVAGEWLKEVFALPRTASFAMVTGCQMAHVTCLAAARHKLLASRGWDVEAQGLTGAPGFRILTSTEVHSTVPRAARLLGLGTDCVVRLPADENGRLRADALKAALESGADLPTVVVLQAGDLNIGAFDNFAELVPLAQKFKAWVHVDGAFGLWVAASPRLRHLLNASETADSWATDGHKWLNVPYDCGYAFVADADAHRSAFAAHAAYITHVDGVRDPLDWNMEWSRRARGFATYAALRQLGRRGIAEMIERHCDCAKALVAGIGALRGAEVVWMPQINQGLLRFVPSEGATPEACDAFTEHVMAAINDSGEAYFTGTTWRGRRAMRVSVCNWRTTLPEVDRVVRAVSKVLAEQNAS